MSGFETPARRSALVSLVAGLTLTDSGIIGSPLSLSGLVEAKDLDEQPPRGRAMVYLAPVVSNTRPRGLWMGLSQTWRLLLYVPVTMAATSAVLDEVQEELMVALRDSTLGGAVWEGSLSLSTQMDDAHALCEAVFSVSYATPVGV